MKVLCGICGQPVKGNVQPGRGGVICGLCVQRKVLYVERLEREHKMPIRNALEYSWARTHERQCFMGKDLKLVRKGKGWSQTRLAHQLGVDRSFIGNIETGRKALSPGVIEFISQNKEILSTSRYSFRKKVSKKALKTNKFRGAKTGVSGLFQEKPMMRPILQEKIPTLRCDCCGEMREEHEVSVEETKGHRLRNVCDFCLDKKLENKMGATG